MRKLLGAAMALLVAGSMTGCANSGSFGGQAAGGMSRIVVKVWTAQLTSPVAEQERHYPVDFRMEISTQDPDLIITAGEKYKEPLVYTKATPFEQPVQYEQGASFLIEVTVTLTEVYGAIVYCRFFDAGGNAIVMPGLPTNATNEEVRMAPLGPFAGRMVGNADRPGYPFPTDARGTVTVKCQY